MLKLRPSKVQIRANGATMSRFELTEILGVVLETECDDEHTLVREKLQDVVISLEASFAIVSYHFP